MRDRKKFILFYIIMFILPLVTFALICAGYMAYRTYEVYVSVKGNEHHWRGRGHRADTELGFSPIPNSAGARVFPIGPDIPVRYDDDGFRVPVDYTPKLSQPRPLVITLGCSFTFGDAVHAEDTYPYLVGQYLHGTAKNAGVCSFGLSQMLILSRKLVPIYRPDYLLVQYSTWLVDRARRPFAPSYQWKLPSPYFYEENNRFVLHGPVFLTKVGDTPVDKYRNTPKSMTDACSFFWNVVLPLDWYDNYNMFKYEIKKGAGRIPRPTNATDALIKYVYSEISNVAAQYGAKLVIVVLGSNDKPVDVDKKLFPADAIIVNAHDALLAHLAVLNLNNKAGYQKEYAHWRGSPPKIVDKHPNETAHRIIAEQIVSKINEATIQQPK